MKKVIVYLLCILVLPYLSYAGALKKCEGLIRYPGKLQRGFNYIHPTNVCNVKTLDAYLDFNNILEAQMFNNSNQCLRLVKLADDVYESEMYQKNVKLVASCGNPYDYEGEYYKCLNQVCQDLTYIKNIKEYKDFESFVVTIKRRQMLLHVVLIVLLVVFYIFLLKKLQKK